MKYLAHELYAIVDVDSADGVANQVDNFCAYHEGDVKEMTSSFVEFYDGSTVSYDDYSITAEG